MTLLRTLPLLLLLSAGVASADDTRLTGVYELKGSYADDQKGGVADSAVKLTVTQERGRLKFKRTSSIPEGPHQTLLPVAWESKRVRDRGTYRNDQGSYHHYEVTYPVVFRERRGAAGALNGDANGGRRVTRELTVHYYFPTDDPSAVGELATNDIGHTQPADWKTLRSFGSKTAEAPATTTPTLPPARPTTPIRPPVVDRFGADGFDRQGFDRNGYNRLGFDRYGFDRLGFDRYGYNRHGFDRAGFNRSGRDIYGYDRYGRDVYGYDRQGFDRYGFNRHGYNRSGFDRYGRHVSNRGYTRGYVPRSPSIVIGSPNNNVRIYPNGTRTYRSTTTTITPNGSITRSRSHRSSNRGGVSINLRLGR